MKLILILSTIILLSSTTAQRTCFPGTIRVGTTCETCPPGTYSPDYNRLFCTKCPKATFRSKPGAKSRRQCTPCAAGTASNVLGAASCTPCEPGTDSLPRSIRCRRCPAGYELANVPHGRITLVSVSGCKKCQPDHFAPERGSNICLPCPAGAIAREEGSTECMKCPPGTFRSEHPLFDDEPFGCMPCSPGRFSDRPGSKVCGRCPPGTFSKRRATRCKPCQRNMFSNIIPATLCEPCPAGTSTTGFGAAGCKHHTKGCPFGTFEDKRGVCKACSPGEKLEPEQRICIPCEENEISDGGDTTVCHNCPPGKVPLNYSLKEKFQFVCAPGTIEIVGLGCLPCLAGTSWYDKNQNSGFDGFLPGCSECGSGSSAEPGSVECKKCPVDTFADERGSPTCQPCPPGFKSPKVAPGADDDSNYRDRSSCVDEETGCEPGEIFAEKGGCKRDTCPSRNRYLVLDERKRKICLSCREDEKVVIDSRGIGTCDDCTEDEFNTEKASTECMKCPSGQKATRHSNIVRRCSCKNGNKLMNGRCVETCPAGWAARLISSSLSYKNYVGCVRCADHSPRLFALSAGNGCTECPREMISVNSTRCIRCPDGEVVARNLFGELTNACIAK